MNTQILIQKATNDREVLKNHLGELEKVRQPMEAYLCYGGTLGFVNYMDKNDIKPEQYKRVTEYYNCSCMDAIGNEQQFSDFLENELKILNDLHVKIVKKIADCNEALSNFAANDVSIKDKSIVERLKGSATSVRNKITDNYNKWQAEANTRIEKRKAGKLPVKQYENANDTLYADASKAPKTDTISDSWIKNNMHILQIGIALISLTLIALTLGTRLGQNK